MKKHQFEEITAALSIIIMLLSYHFGFTVLFYVYAVKAIIDTWCAVYYSYKAAKKKPNNSQENGNNRNRNQI